MFPIRDNVEADRTPYVNYAIIALCVIAYFFELTAPQGMEQFVHEYGMIPVRVTHPSQASFPVEVVNDWGQIREHVIEFNSPVSPWATLITCMFLHGGLMHIVGNLWFLYIFGDNVEDRFGHFGYAIMYLACGLAAGLMQVATDWNSFVPTVGASGAIAGVMGSYLLLYPKAMVATLIPLGIFTQVIMVPAPLFLGFWFLVQVLSGFQMHAGSGGVAWWAHIGGFAAGFLMTLFLNSVGGLNPPPRHVYDSREEMAREFSEP